MQTSSIEWTGKTWNPTSGCDKVSAGCRHCYAETIANRFKGAKAFPNGFEFTIHADRFQQPVKLRKPSLIFVNSMSDLFHEQMPPETIEELFGIMGSCPRHKFQILTKRHERLVELAPSLPWYDNVWIGASIENQANAVRADFLKRVPAKVRFLSCEPLLGPLKLNLDDIHWVIIGGESGPGCRPMDLEWARIIRDQCDAAGVACFVKQLGGYPEKRHKIADFPIDLQIREMPAADLIRPSGYIMNKQTKQKEYTVTCQLALTFMISAIDDDHAIEKAKAQIDEVAGDAPFDLEVISEYEVEEQE